MVKIYPHVAGNTLGTHKKILKKLKKRGIKVSTKLEKSHAIIVFCPIVSRFDTDVKSALTGIAASSPEQVLVLVAMHHTFDPDYTLPDNRNLDSPVKLCVDCLFFENKGLLKCPRNKNAVKKICKALQMKKTPCTTM